MGILRDIIGGAVQQGMATRSSNSTNDSQPYQPDQSNYVLPQIGLRGRRARGRRCQRRQYQDRGPDIGREIVQYSAAPAPRLPPRPGLTSTPFPRQYHSVNPSDALASLDRDSPFKAESDPDPDQATGVQFRQQAYPLGPALPAYDEEGYDQEEGDGWYGLSVPVALPQAGFGQGVPFVRAYSDLLEDAGILQRVFIEFLDNLNATVIPNPEAQLANKAAGLAGWFVPGAGGIALGLVQVGSQIGGAMHLKQATASCLQRANQTIFAPAGLEALICKSQEIDNTVGCQNTFAVNSPPGSSYIDKLLSYGSHVAPLTVLPAASVGRSDLMAQLGASLSSRSRRKNEDRAAKDMQSGKMKRTTAMENSFNWLLIRNIMT